MRESIIICSWAITTMLPGLSRTHLHSLVLLIFVDVAVVSLAGHQHWLVFERKGSVHLLYEGSSITSVFCELLWMKLCRKKEQYAVHTYKYSKDNSRIFEKRKAKQVCGHDFSRDWMSKWGRKTSHLSHFSNIGTTTDICSLLS